MLKYSIKYIILKQINLKLLSLNVNKKASIGLVVRVIQNSNNLNRKKHLVTLLKILNFKVLAFLL